VPARAGTAHVNWLTPTAPRNVDVRTVRRLTTPEVDDGPSVTVSPLVERGYGLSASPKTPVSPVSRERWENMEITTRRTVMTSGLRL
jgi:hypothetical protein